MWKWSISSTYICIFKNSVQYVTLEILIRSAGKLLGISSVANSFEENKTKKKKSILEAIFKSMKTKFVKGQPMVIHVQLGSIRCNAE